MLTTLVSRTAAWVLALAMLCATQVVLTDPAIADTQPQRSALAAADTSPKYQPVSPTRLLDTRSNGKRLSPQSSINVRVLGVAGVPTGGVAAVSINLTAVDPGGKGYLTAHAADVTRPLVSTVNFRQGENTANHAIVPIGSNGEITIYSHAASDVIVDITGYTPDNAGLQTVAPVRALDTRTQNAPVPARGERRLPMTGNHGIPSTGVDAVIVNVTAVDPEGNGFFTAYPSGTQRTETSTLNFNTGENTANNATVKLGTDGAISIYTHTTAHILVDVVGYVKTNDAYAAVAPARSVDTRKLSIGKMRAGETRTLHIAGRLGLPIEGITAVALNATAVNPSAKGYLALFPADVSRPLVSAVNFDAGDNTANNALVKLSADGAISIYSLVDCDVVVDIVGYTTAAMPYSGATTTNNSGRTTTTVRKENTPTTINATPDLPAAAAQSLDALVSKGNIVGTPVDLTLNGDFPTEGVRLERTYPSPLPDDATVSFMYWDTTANQWVPVPGVISADRRSAHAIIHHYSFWGDFISSASDSLDTFRKQTVEAFTAIGNAAEKTIVDVSNTLAYEAGSFFDSRTEPQPCDVPLPRWVQNTAFIEQHFNNPVHWCVQGVPGNSTQVSISAKANRGHGFVLGNVPDGMTVTNDSFDFDLNKTLTDITTDRGAVIANSPMAVLYSDKYIPPGATVTITFDEDTYYDTLNQQAVVKVETPHWFLAISSFIVNQIIGTGEGLLNGRAAAAILLTNCWVKSKNVDGLRGNSLGLAACLGSANGLEDFGLPKLEVGRSAALKINLTMVLFAAVNNGTVFVTDNMVDGAAYKATVFGVPLKHTRTYEIVPFTADGQLAAGWSIEDEGRTEPLTGCFPTYTSLTAGVMDCGTHADSCHETFYNARTPGYGYCYNTGSKTLRKVPIDKPDTNKTEAQVRPSKIQTVDGSLYFRRFAGSWSSYGQYYPVYGCLSGPCETNSDLAMVVFDSVEDDADFDTSRPLWRVRVAGADNREEVPPPPWVDVLKVWYLRNSTFS